MSEIIKDWIYLLDPKNLLNETKICIDQSKKYIDSIIKINLVTEEDVKNALNICAKNTFEFNTFYATFKMYKTINNVKEYQRIEKLFDNYFTELYSNHGFYNKITEIRDKVSGDAKIFLTHIIEQYEKTLIDKSQNPKLKIIIEYINKLYDRVKNDSHKLSIPFSINANYVHNNVLQQINNHASNKDNKIKLFLNHENYNFIMSALKNANDRENLEKLYCDMSNDIVKNYTKMIIAQHEYAKRNNKNSYGEMVNKKNNSDFESITAVLKKIITDLSPHVLKIFSVISSDLKTDKVTHADTLYWLYHKKNELKFSPNEVILLFSQVVKNIFGLSMTINDNISAWDQTVMTCSIQENECLRGYIFFDLLMRNNKSTCPTTIILKNFNAVSNNVPIVAIISGFSSLSEKILTTNDAIYLFKQLGKAIHNLSHRSKFGLNNTEEFSNLMSNLMEYLFIEHLPQKYIDICKIEKILLLFNGVIDSLFDILIHSSVQFVNLCKDLAKDEDGLDKHMNKLYFNLYDNIMGQFKDKFKYTKNGISPLLLNKLINGHNCNLYNIHLTNIVSYNVCNIIKKYKSGTRFVKYVLENPNNYLKHLIDNFFTIEKSEHNMFELKSMMIYLTNNKFLTNTTNDMPKIKEKVNKISV